MSILPKLRRLLPGATKRRERELKPLEDRQRAQNSREANPAGTGEDAYGSDKWYEEQDALDEGWGAYNKKWNKKRGGKVELGGIVGKKAKLRADRRGR